MLKLNNKVPAIVFIFSLIITLVTTNYVKDKQLELKLARFNYRIDANTIAIKHQIDSDFRTINAAASFYQTLTGDLTTTFHSFAAEIIKNSQSIVGLQWMEKITPDDLPPLKQRMQKDHPNFNIYTVPKDQAKYSGYLYPDNRPIYVATNIYPTTKANNSLLGFYSSRERFRLILEDIFSSGKANVSDPIRLIQDGFDRNIKKDGLLIYYPVYTANKSDLKGVIIGAVRMSTYFQDLLLNSPEKYHIPMKIIDTGFDSEDLSTMFISPQWETDNGRIFSKQIVLQNRTWIVNYKFNESLDNINIIILLTVFSIGVFIATLLFLITRILHKQNKKIAKKLVEKTKELQFMVDHDSLTGLKNRRAFNKILHTKMHKSEHFALASFDIDKFKDINDTFGHLGGDAVLQDLATKINASLPTKAYSFRLGGDEFCILARFSKAQLPHYLQTLQDTIEASPCQYNQQKIIYTISIGATISQPKSKRLDTEVLKKQIERLQHSADNALYTSKNQGRNHFTIVD